MTRERSLSSRTLDDVLNAFASNAPVPGGGSAAALAGALGVALLIMVATLKRTRTGDEESDWLADAAERLAAVNLYLALMTEACLDLIGAKGPVFVEGPFALNRAYLTALAAVTGSDVIALPGSTGTSQGAALLTGIRPPAAAEKAPLRADLQGLRPYRQAWRDALAD